MHCRTAHQWKPSLSSVHGEDGKGTWAQRKGRSGSTSHSHWSFHACSNRKQYKWSSLPTVAYQMQWAHINPCFRNAFEITKAFLGHRATHGPLAITHGKIRTQRQVKENYWNDKFIAGCENVNDSGAQRSLTDILWKGSVKAPVLFAKQRETWHDFTKRLLPPKSFHVGSTMGLAMFDTAVCCQWPKTPKIFTHCVNLVPS